MKDTIKTFISKLDKSEIQFADIRYTSIDEESFYFERGILANHSAGYGFNSVGVRVLIDGTWGFAGTNDISVNGMEKAMKTAINNAKTGAIFRRQKVKFPSVSPTVESYEHKPKINPFLMSKDDKISYLANIASKLNGHEQIVHNILFVSFYKMYKIYANTEGTFTTSEEYHTMPEFQVYASNGSEVQVRTFPGDMSSLKGGFEIVDQFNFEGNIEPVVKEARDLLVAPRITEEKADLIIGHGQLALQLHESIGHATEADRIFGMEISYAGKTFIKPEMIGSFKYGSDIVNVISDSSDQDGMGYHPVDDEGIPGKRVDIIKNGILVNQQTSREVATLLGLEPSSNMKASNGFDYPLVRMTNFSLLPGNAGTLQDLIKNTENGYFIDHTKSWSIDDNRNNFQFTTEIGWKIKDGEITGIVKEPTYYGITKDFWNSCDAICSESEWKYQGTFHCGKGEPGQVMHLSHKVAPARFKNIVVNIKA